MRRLSDPIDLLSPASLRFGDGTLAGLGDWIDAQGYRSPFIIADAFNATRLECLGLGSPACFGDVEPEPSLPNLVAAIAATEAAQADVILGFGGGSAMDLAKLVAVMAGSGLSLGDISGPNCAPARRLGLVQIPTTAGTGSEVGTRALITDPETQAKIATESPHLLADLAIIDPSLTHSLPAAITAATGVDAMAHCTEAFTSKRAHPIIDTYALKGIELVGRFLPRAVEDGSDSEARAGLSLAALYGGICLGPVNTTAGHAVAYPLGTRYKMAHGLANALIFPHVLAVNSSATPTKAHQITQALGFGGTSKESIRLGALEFCQDLGIDMRLGAHGVAQTALPDMATEAHSIRRLLDWNPVDLSVTDIEDLYQRAY